MMRDGLVVSIYSPHYMLGISNPLHEFNTGSSQSPVLCMSPFEIAWSLPASTKRSSGPTHIQGHLCNLGEMNKLPTLGMITDYIP